MNNELLKLFDIKNDDVESFTVNNKESNYEINIKFKPSRLSCPACGSPHFISKSNKNFIYSTTFYVPKKKNYRYILL